MIENLVIFLFPNVFLIDHNIWVQTQNLSGFKVESSQLQFFKIVDELKL